MTQDIQKILIFLGEVIAVGGTAAAIAYSHFLGLQEMAANKFSERLEAFKPEQECEIERYCFQ